MLKRNIFINYASQLYLAALNLIVVPIYLKLLGAEAYGLIGIFIMVQSLMQVLDVGMSATLSREATKYMVSPETAQVFRYVFDRIFKFFLFIALSLVVVLLPLINTYALDWLNYKLLNPDDILISVSLIPFIVALRFVANPLRNVLLGFEKHFWLNLVIIVTGTLKYLGVIPVLIYYSRNPVVFFVYEFGVAALETVIIFFYTFRLIPQKSTDDYDLFSKSEASQKLINFSAGLGLVTVLWVVLSQIDRVILSKFLQLEDYGYFSAAVTAATGIILLSSPLSRALLPRMTALVEKKDFEALHDLYGKSTRLISLSIVPIGLFVMGFSAELLWIWTGNKELALYGQKVLFWYCLGNVCLAFAAFPYYLQYAYGELRLHVYGNVISFVIGIPLIFFLGISYGAIGTGIAWAILQAGYLLIGTYVIHKKFLQGMHWRWVLCDVLPGFLISVALVFLAKNLELAGITMERSTVMSRLALAFVFILSICLAALRVSNVLRR